MADHSEEIVRTPEEIAANVLRIQAEAMKFKAEAAEAEANAQKALIEANFGQENIEHIRMMRMGQEVQTRALIRQEQEQLAASKYHHVYHFTQAVGQQSVHACMEQINIWHRLDPECAFEIVFTSPGGDVIAGMALFDYIQQKRQEGHHVTTSTIGYAASMAGILLQAGDTRIMGREAYLLIHQVSFGAGGTFGQVEDEVKFVEKIQNRVLDIFAARTNLTKKQLDKAWQRTDWWLDSTEALKDGFVDLVR